MTEQFANFSQSTLSAQITAAQTTITINTPASGQTFPSSGNFRIVVQTFDATTQLATSQPEIMIVTAVAGNQFTVQRGAESTKALAYPGGAQVTHTVTAAVMTALESGSGGSGVTSFNTRTGAVTLDSADVDTALGYTPLQTVAVDGTSITGDGTSGNPLIAHTSGGSGTVTSVSVVTANGISGSVATATTTPAITLTLGAITPTSVNSIVLSGSSTPTLAVTGTSTVSGANTGDQINITGNAGTATALQAARTIAGVSFDGTANIAIPASGLSNGVTGSGAIVLANSPTIATAVLGSSTATTQSPADNSTKLATTAYVDNAVLGQDFKQAVTVATTSPLATYVYNNGASGSGATITLVGTGAVAFDGTTLTLNMPVLVKNETSTNTPNNGIYTVTQAGALGVVLILTRRNDFDQSTDIDTGDSVFVTSGTTQSTTTWAYNGINAPTIGTTNITFAQTAGQGSFTAGNGIAITGTSIAIDTSVTVDKTTAQTLSNKTFVAPALGTPASGVATNLTGTAAGLTAGISNALKSATTTVSVSGSTAPISGQVLTATSGTAATWQTPSAGGSSSIPVIDFTSNTTVSTVPALYRGTLAGSVTLTFPASPSNGDFFYAGVDPSSANGLDLSGNGKSVINIANGDDMTEDTLALFTCALFIYDSSATTWWTLQIQDRDYLSNFFLGRNFSSTNNAIATWAGTGGAGLNNTSVIIDGSNNITGVNTINAATTKQLASNFTTSSTTGANTNLTFAIASQESWDVTIVGTAQKATSGTGLKLGISIPSGCTLKGWAELGGTAFATALTISSMTSGALGSTFSTSIGVEVPFRLQFSVRNSTTAGSITLQGATVTSNVATIFAGTSMRYVKGASV